MAPSFEVQSRRDLKVVAMALRPEAIADTAHGLARGNLVLVVTNTM